MERLIIVSIFDELDVFNPDMCSNSSYGETAK
jgi:hypothetical protein